MGTRKLCHEKENREPLDMRNSLLFLAGAEGLEPSTNGFGDRYSTN